MFKRSLNLVFIRAVEFLNPSSCLDLNLPTSRGTRWRLHGIRAGFIIASEVSQDPRTLLRPLSSARPCLQVVSFGPQPTLASLDPTLFLILLSLRSSLPLIFLFCFHLFFYLSVYYDHIYTFPFLRFPLQFYIPAFFYVF